MVLCVWFSLFYKLSFVSTGFLCLQFLYKISLGHTRVMYSTAYPCKQQMGPSDAEMDASQKK